MNEHEIAARAALADALIHHERQIARITAALEALNGGPVVPLVRPPAPDIIAPPVEMPKVPEREQRPAARKVLKHDDDAIVACARAAFERGESMGKAVAATFNMAVATADTKLSDLRRRRDDVPRHTPGRPRSQSTHEAVVERAATQDVFKCVTCAAVFTERPKLANHTIISHGRGPTSIENTPLDNEVAA